MGCPHTRGRLSAWDTSSQEGHEGGKSTCCALGKKLNLGEKAEVLDASANVKLCAWPSPDPSQL